MEDIKRKLLLFGRSRSDDLQAYVSSLRIEEITAFITSAIGSPEFPQYFNCFLYGFTKTRENDRQQVVKHILDVIGCLELSTVHQEAVIEKLSVELYIFSVPHLVEFCSLCVDMIHVGECRTNLIWKNLLPKLLFILLKEDALKYDNVDLTGREFKTQIINALCVVRWCNDVVISLTHMFGKLELSKEEHQKVCNKLCLKIFEIEPSSIPPFIHQLLILCDTYNNISPIFAVTEYFSNNLHKSCTDLIDSVQTELESIESDPRELLEAESTVLYHFYCSAQSHQRSGISHFLTTLQTINKWPEFILRPFPIMLLLTLASIQDFKQTVNEIIKIAIFRKIKQSVLIRKSAWIHEAVKEGVNLNNLIVNIVENSITTRVMVTEGLIELAFHLLQATSDCADEIHKIGITILLKVAKRQRRFAPSILDHFTHLVINNNLESQHTDCLCKLIDYIPFILIEVPENIRKLITKLIQVPGSVSKKVLKSLVPLMKISPPLRDSFILMLRKAIFISGIPESQNSVYGLCMLISNLKVGLANSASLSQQTLLSSSSKHSLFSQSINSEDQQTSRTCNVSSFESICLEIMDVLRQGLKQSNDVKLEIYKGLPEAVNKNPAMCCVALEILKRNLEENITTDKFCLTPIKFDKIVVVKDEEILLTDSLGYLVTAITSILVVAVDTDSTSKENLELLQVTELLNDICIKMQRSKLADYGLDEDIDLNDGEKESRKKTEILKQLLMLQESLIIYKIWTWCSESKDLHGEDVLSLFKIYKLFSDYSKSIPKTKKGVKRKTVHQSTITNTQSGTKVDKFKTPRTLFTLPILKKLLGLLYSDTNDCTQNEKTKCLKANRDLHHYALQNFLTILQELSNTKEMTEISFSKKMLQHLYECGKIIYDNCISKLMTLVDFDLTTAIYAAETMYNVLYLFDKYDPIFDNFISVLYPKHKQKKFDEIFSMAFAVYKDHLKTYLKCDTELSIDEDSKIAVSLIHSVKILCSHLPIHHPLATEALKWLKQLALDIKIETKSVTKAFMTSLFQLEDKVEITSNLSEDVAIQMCSLMDTIDDEEIECKKPLALITELTMESAVQCLYDKCKEDLNYVDWMIRSVNAHCTVLLHSVHKESNDLDLQAKEKLICDQLRHTIIVMNILSNAKIPIGSCSDSLLKTLLRLYTSLFNFTKYFVKRNSSSSHAFLKARFEMVVKLAGKRLCLTVYSLITYIEETQDNRIKSKVVRQSKVIPNLVFAMETFKNSVVTLANKSSESAKKLLLSLVNVGTNRDFRLKLQKIQEALNKLNNDESVISEANDSESRVSETELENDPDNQSDSESAESTPQERKRRA